MLFYFGTFCFSENMLIFETNKNSKGIDLLVDLYHWAMSHFISFENYIWDQELNCFVMPYINKNKTHQDIIYEYIVKTKKYILRLYI
jgi:hypothetical protein